MDYLHYDDRLLCATLLCLASALSYTGAWRHDSGHLWAGWAADDPVHHASEWVAERNSSLSWGIYRNIPFALLGLLMIVLFYQSAKQHNDRAFRWMWLTIVLSFGFYIPVVLWADVVPLIGMLMIPKTCAYVWTVCLGYRAMKNEIT